MTPTPALYQYAAPAPPDPGPQDLTPGRRYARVIDPHSAQYGFVRVVDDSGSDYLYPGAWFAPIEPALELPRRGPKPAIVLRLAPHPARVFSLDDFAHVPKDILVGCMLFTTGAMLAKALRLADEPSREAFLARAKPAGGQAAMRLEFLSAMKEAPTDEHWTASMALLGTLAAECDSGAANSMAESEWHARCVKAELEQASAEASGDRRATRL